jgi:hypothetical protein
MMVNRRGAVGGRRSQGWLIGLMILLTICCCTTPLRAQAAGGANDGSGYALRRGTNEFGLWGGGAFSATSALGGLHRDEAGGRRFVIAALRYGRTLAASKRMALQYTLDAIPVAVAVGDITSATRATPDGAIISARRESSYGFGLTPLGLQLDFANSSRIKPFVHLNAGGVAFTKPVPLPDASRLVFTLEGGGGARIFTSERRAVTLGVRLHHISNGNRSGANRGLNQFVFYAGFSIFK